MTLRLRAGVLGLTLVALVAFVAGLAAMWLASSLARDHRTSSLAGDAKETAAAASPDQRYVARVILPDLDGLGATISQPIQVWVESKGGNARLMFEADKTDGVRLSWKAAQQLEVCYSDAQINRFSNRFVEVTRSGDVPQVVALEVILRRVKLLDECLTP
jgi:hypothetical protein